MLRAWYILGHSFGYTETHPQLFCEHSRTCFLSVQPRVSTMVLDITTDRQELEKDRLALVKCTGFIFF